MTPEEVREARLELWAKERKKRKAIDDAIYAKKKGRPAPKVEPEPEGLDEADHTEIQRRIAMIRAQKGTLD